MTTPCSIRLLDGWYEALDEDTKTFRYWREGSSQSQLHRPVVFWDLPVEVLARETPRYYLKQYLEKFEHKQALLDLQHFVTLTKLNNLPVSPERQEGLEQVLTWLNETKQGHLHRHSQSILSFTRARVLRSLQYPSLDFNPLQKLLPAFLSILTPYVEDFAQSSFAHGLSQRDYLDNYSMRARAEAGIPNPNNPDNPDEPDNPDSPDDPCEPGVELSAGWSQPCVYTQLEYLLNQLHASKPCFGTHKSFKISNNFSRLFLEMNRDDVDGGKNEREADEKGGGTGKGSGEELYQEMTRQRRWGEVVNTSDYHWVSYRSVWLCSKYITSKHSLPLSLSLSVCVCNYVVDLYHI